MKAGKFLIGVLLLLSTSVYSQNPNFYIYLCFGQSNMEGQGTIEAVDKQVDSRFKVFQAVDCSNLNRKKATWRTAVPPLCRCFNGLSPADYFGRTLIDNLPDSVTVGVINVAVGGCRIELFDKDIYLDYDSTYTDNWFQNILIEYNRNPYAHLIELAQQAQKDGVIKGFLLHQGESNTGDTQWPSKVKKIYNDLIIDLNLEADSIPLLAGEVVHADQGGVCASMNSIIAKLPQTLPNSYVIPSNGCTDKEDNIHFNSAGYRELGIRYAKQMLNIMGIEMSETDTSSVGLNSLPDNNYQLKPGFPNPVSGKTNISFEIPDNTLVSLKLYDIKGNEVDVLACRDYEKGMHSIEYDTRHLSEGIYFYTLKAENFVASQKMIVLGE